MSEPILSPEELAALRAKNIANISAKLEAGKTLTARDHAALDAAYNGTEGTPIWADNIALLSRALGIERSTVHALCDKAREANKNGGKAPRRLQDGKYRVSEWLEYARIEAPNAQGKVNGAAAKANGETHGYELSKKETISLATVQLRFDRELFELDLAKGKFILKTEAADQIRRCNEQVKNELTRRFGISAPAEYAQVQGDANECREINKRHLEEIFEYLHSGLWNTE